jgi:phosphatidylserine/phosphatidylglycerophosphate/cardiolipin synthase-like enzyme/membrane protein YqaA with SNARE-associated domain
VYALSWDFAMLYALEREWLPVYKLDWRTHRRLSFRLDDQHPTGASHHQKVVVVDDEVAFVSGYDLTRVRWDTSAHAPEDPRRRTESGEPYPPFHDVGIVVEGDCARALGELARERWRRATGREPRAVRAARNGKTATWPDGVDPVLVDVDVAIARTEPAFAGRGPVQEIRALTLDAIAAARHSIFAENQYFTSRTVADAFARSLAEERGPEIAVVSPYMQSGWLEISTMGVLRGRIHRTLHAADVGSRYRLYYPVLPWLAGQGCLNVHSKVLVVDDAFVTIGSANLSDRSLGLDTECNLALESRGDPRIGAAIAGLRDRLLGEHLDREPGDVGAAIVREGSLHRAIASLAHDGRTLREMDTPLDPSLDALVPDHSVLDPERPIDPDEIVADLVPHDQARSGARAKLIALGAVVAALALLALAWRFTPLHDWLSLDRLIAAGEALERHPYAPFAVLAAFVVGGLVVVPLLLLISVTAAVFGPLLGIVYSLAGSLLSGCLLYAIGRKLGRQTVRRIAGRRLNKLSRRLAKRGLLAIVFVRMMPVAPFSIVNVVAGAAHIGWRDFVLGTILGLLPGILLISLFIDRATAAVRDPGPGTFALLTAAAGAVLVVAYLLNRRLGARAPEPQPASHGS